MLFLLPLVSPRLPAASCAPPADPGGGIKHLPVGREAAEKQFPIISTGSACKQRRTNPPVLTLAVLLVPCTTCSSASSLQASPD